MADDIYIPLHSNGGSVEQTPNVKLNDNLGAMYNALFNIQDVSANHNALSGEMVRMTTGATGKDVVLEATVVGKTLVIYVIKSDVGAGAVTVKCTGADKIEGVATDTLSSQNDKQKYISVNGGEWKKW